MDWDNFTEMPGRESSFLAQPAFNQATHNRFIGRGYAKPEVAGNYGMHSNVFQVGVTVCLSPRLLI